MRKGKGTDIRKGNSRLLRVLSEAAHYEGRAERKYTAPIMVKNNEI